jgi:phospholipid/cholesterol/gamma-HCH transport system substrate-binding protein
VNHTTRTSSAAVGAFVLIMLVILIVGSLWIAGSDAFGTSGATYRVRLEDSSGISAGDRVRVAGVPAGRIRGVTLDPLDELPVTMEITLKPGIEMKADAHAVVASEGLLGSAFLQVHPGSAESAPLAEGSEIHGETGLGMDDAMARIDDLAASAVTVLEKTSTLLDTTMATLEPVLSNLEKMISEENAESTRMQLRALRQTAEDAGPRITTLIERLDATVASLDEGADELPALIAGMSDLADNLQAALGPDGARLAAVLDAAESSLNSAGDAFGDLRGNGDEITATLRDLRDTMANMKAFSQEIKERPYGLVRIRNPAERRPGDDVPKGDR